MRLRVPGDPPPLQIKGLRLIGFKSFVEPTDLLIEPGLTGVVGPNGCGKSNLLEALRWVMGETSYKSMRASSMEDVIFSGTDGRPERNAAEVMITLDNAERSAPSEYNENDVIEITRRIERDAGSIYRVNGKEVRARDVKVLFEDAATGARSHALVRQGQIGELITAKPEKRRRILEDAAGIAGLHTRKHEAEIKLRAADGNLGRMEDLLGQLNGQMNGLKRQARQAIRYKEIAGEIRETEAIIFHLGWLDVQKTVADVEQGLQGIVRDLASATEAESVATRTQFMANKALQPLRDREAERAAAMQRLKLENENLNRERERVQERTDELSARLVQLKSDLTRETEAASEAASEITRLSNELTNLKTSAENETASKEQAAQALEQANAALAAQESELTEANRQRAELAAEHRRIETQKQDVQKRRDRLTSEQSQLANNLSALNTAAPELAKSETLATEITTRTVALRELEEQAIGAENFAQARAGDERKATATANEERIALKNIEAERDALTRLIGSKSKSSKSRPVIDQTTVQDGYEKALAAALGDELDLPVDESEQGTFWRAGLMTVPGPELPADSTPLTRYVTAPEALARRLNQIGVVPDNLGDELQGVLSSGQRLVSREGSMWRWDGLVMRAGAETAAARRLAMRNRLKALDQDHTVQDEKAKKSAAAAERAKQAAETARANEKKLRDAWRTEQSALAGQRDALAELERKAQKTREQIASLTTSQARIASELAETLRSVAAVAMAAESLDDPTALTERVEALSASVTTARNTALEKRSEVARLATERQERATRITRLTDDIARWTKRTESASQQIKGLNTRIAETASESEKLASQPEAISNKQASLQEEITKAEQSRKDAADRLAIADTECRTAEAALREAQTKVATLREKRAGNEARLEAARERMADQARAIRETLECTPDKCLELAGTVDPEKLPPLAELERKAQRLKADRERLGGVNLRAEEELAELTEQFDGMETERADLEEAIAQLRQGISKLNKEARRRLLDAFEKVDSHFQRLFKTLFNGGEAELKLVDSDDPLEAGLEIVARPPGKKPVTLSLLSGGEQALTATALTFAVFLTNPSPICVLDEVDAPLDDANVDRYCDLMDEMSRSTDTRFLVITHHPNTMARMARLFGVTMMEKGVSQLVSVDLATAEQFRDVG